MSDPSLATRDKAFSLIELLVVLGLIALFLGWMSTAQPRSGKPLEAAQKIAAAMVRAARSEALLSNNTTRLLVCQTDTDARGTMKCVLGIIARDKNTAQEQPGAWIPVQSGVTLPSGIYFNVDLSNGKKDLNTQLDGQLESLFSGPLTAKTHNTIRWYYYEFGPDGRLTQAKNQRFILTQESPIQHKRKTTQSPGAGFVIHTSGRILPETL